MKRDGHSHARFMSNAGERVSEDVLDAVMGVQKISASNLGSDGGLLARKAKRGQGDEL